MIRIVFAVTAALVIGLSADAVGTAKKLQESFWQVYTSALRGDRVAEYQVGVMYERGIGVERDQAKAAEWYEKSAWQGYVNAQYNLALMYASGRGVDQNEERAMIWLAKAARQGDKEARQLLLEIIDGKHQAVNPIRFDTATGANGAEAEAIDPVTLVTREGAQVCEADGECTPYKPKTTLTSKSKRGHYYKISGVGTKKGWEPFEGEGWIDENSVDIRR
ncbi:MAG: sel1 repeat family protein [Campylobacterales bacterium]|nr:sel1 repeat family protein [Campylobacterales bacterium]